MVGDIAYNFTGDRPFDSYNGNQTQLGLAFDASASRSIFYIGDDSALYQLKENSNYNDTFRTVQAPGSIDDNTAQFWPRADIPHPDFAVAYNSNLDKIWIFYMVNGSMAQVHQSSAGVWEPAIALPKFNATAASESEPGGPPDDNSNNDGSGGGGAGLSSSGKTGVGVGVGLGLPIIGALIAAYTFWHSRRSRQNREAEFDAVREAHAEATSPGAATATTSFLAPSTGSPAPGYTSGVWGDGGAGGGGGGYWANGQWVQPYSDVQQQQMFAGKPDGNGGLWQQQQQQQQQQQAIDPRFSQLYVGGTPQPQPPVHEMPHQEPTFEVAGDGQVPEMPGSQAVPTPTPAPAPDPAPTPALSPAPPTSPSHRAVSPMPETDAQPK